MIIVVRTCMFCEIGRRTQRLSRRAMLSLLLLLPLGFTVHRDVTTARVISLFEGRD